ncbi:MAG: hypothetical protein ACRCYY_20950 [Trueperaceae bacterium]
MPVLVPSSELQSWRLAAQSMRAVANEVESAIVPGSGHWLPEENELLVLE